MRRKHRPADFSHEQPPRELLRFVPSEPPPIGPHGRPEPWAVKWTTDEFADWLRARAAWRNDHHANPLPGLPARERHMMSLTPDLPDALVDGEKAALRTAPAFPYRPAGPVAERPAPPASFSSSEAGE